MKKFLLTTAFTLSIIPSLIFTNVSAKTTPSLSETAESETTDTVSVSEVENPNTDIPYSEIQEYLNDGAELDADGNAMLVDSVSFEDGDKELITVATKDGSVFYIIIDHTAEEGSNVYFLNKVDTADLMAIINSQTETSVSTNSNISVSNETVNSDESQTDESNGEVIAASTTESKSSSNDLGMLIPIIIIGAVIVLAYWFFKIRPGKGKQKGFDDTFEDDEDEEIQEDEEEEDDI